MIKSDILLVDLDKDTETLYDKYYNITKLKRARKNPPGMAEQQADKFKSILVLIIYLIDTIRES